MARFIAKILKKLLPEDIVKAIQYSRNYLAENKRKQAISERNNKLITSLVNGKNPILLELGASGRKMQGWVSLGIEATEDIRYDLLQGIPFPDKSVTKIYASHVLEHFSYGKLVKLLDECYRVLCCGGNFNVAVPNARIYFDAYMSPESFDAAKYIGEQRYFHYHSRIDYVNYMAYMGDNHRFMFDSENLMPILKQAGFKDIKLRGFDPAIDIKNRVHESIYACAVKLE